jgi:hypothetical protein
MRKRKMFDAGAVAAAMLALLLALSGQTSQARDLAGDVQRVKTPTCESCI